MPPVIIAAIYAVGVYVGSQALIMLAAIALMRYQQSQAEKKAREAYNRSQKDRYLMVRGALEPRQIVLGERRVSGPMFYVGTHGTDREHLVFCVALASHKVNAIGDVYLGDEPVVLDGAGNIVGIKRTELFSISVATGSFTLAGKAKSDSVSAVAVYGSDIVALTVTTSTPDDFTIVAVSGARVGEVGQVKIFYQPDPCPYQPEDAKNTFEGFYLASLPQTFTLSHAPVDDSVSVVQNLAGDGGMVSCSFTIVGSAVTVTSGTIANSLTISYQYDDSVSLGRVRKYLGRWDQAADPGMMAALPGVWTSAHRAAGVAYMVVEFDYDRDATSGGVPNASAVVRGIECYDPRKNRVSNPMMDGAIAGAPGTVPTDWFIIVGSGLARELLGTGTDAATGWPYIDIRITGTATLDGTVFVTPVPPTAGPAASAGQTWSVRIGVRRLAGMSWTSWLTRRLEVVAVDAGGTQVGSSLTAVNSVDGTTDPAERTYGAVPTGTARVGMRFTLGYVSGQVVDSTIRVMLPQLWQGAVGDAADPRAWTANPALHCGTYASHPLGGRLPWDQIDLPAMSSQANVCDTNTTYTVGEKDFDLPLYRSHYTALTTQRPTEVLTDLCIAMGGEWVYADGCLRLKAGAWRAPIRTLDESWLQGDQPVQVQASLDRDDMVNAISGAFYDAGQNWQQVDFPAQEPAAYIAADLAKLPLDVDYGAVTFVGQAQYLAACALRAVRQGMVLKVRCNMRAWELESFDVVNVTLARLGFVNKPFEVRLEEWTLDGGIELVLRETDPSTWNMDAGFPAIDPAPNTRLPDPWSVRWVSGLEADSGTAQVLVQADGTVMSRVLVRWNRIEDPRVTDPSGLVEIAYGLAGTAEDEWQILQVPGAEVQAYLTGVEDGSIYLIKARALGSVGMSPWCGQISHLVLGKSAAPTNVDGLSASLIYGAVLIEWQACSDLDYAETELRRGGTSWATAVPLSGSQPTIVRGTKYLWAWPAFGAYTIRAKHRDTSGHESATNDTATVTVDDLIKLGSSGIDVDLGGINLAQNSSFERDSNQDGMADSFSTYSSGTFGTLTSTRVTGRISGLAQRRGATSLGSTSGDRVGFYQEVAVGPGAVQNTVVTAWMKASANVTFRLRIDNLDGSNALVSTFQTTATSDATTWQRVEVDIPGLPANVETLRVYMWIEDRTSGTAVWILVDDLQVEEATSASAWHPYPRESLPKVWVQAADPGAGALDGDEWFDTNDDNKHWVRIGGVWVTVRDAGITQALTDAANAQDTADGKIQSYYQTSPPSGASLGDLWFDTDDGKKAYRWSGSAWVLAQDGGIAQALSDASDAQATADGKVTTFFGASTPTAGAVGDLWFKTSDARMYRWNGSAWVLQSAVGSGDIDTDNIASGAVTDVLRTSVSSVTVTGFTNNLLAYISYTAPVDATVTVSVTAQVVVTKAGSPDPGYAGFFYSLVMNSDYTVSREFASFAVANGTALTYAVVNTETFDVVAGDTNFFNFYGGRGSSDDPCVVTDIRMTAEVKKR